MTINLSYLISTIFYLISIHDPFMDIPDHSCFKKQVGYYLFWLVLMKKG